MIGSGVFTYLSNQSAVTTLVGKRIYPNYGKLTTAYPQLVYECKNAKSTESMDGSGNPYDVEVVIACISDSSYTAADVVGKAVLALMDGFTGTWGTTKVLGCFLEDATEDQVTEPQSEQVLYYVKQLTFAVVCEI